MDNLYYPHFNNYFLSGPYTYIYCHLHYLLVACESQECDQVSIRTPFEFSLVWG